MKRAAFAVIRNKEKKVLSILAPDPARGWELPGGMIEEKESYLEGLVREVFEETGTTIKEIEMFGVYENLSADRTVFGYLAIHDNGSLRTGDETLDLEWLTEAEILDRLEREMVRDRLKDGLSYHGKIVRRSYFTQPYRTISLEKLEPTSRWS